MKYVIIFSMKNFIFLILSAAVTVYTLVYTSLGGFVGNEGALSKIGLVHPVLFVIWGFLTFSVLSFGIVLGYLKTKYKFYIILLLIAFVGIALTVFCDFDYDNRLQYTLHCVGSLSFSAVTGINIFFMFLLTKRYFLTAVSGAVLLGDLVLLLIFKETAFIELIPIITAYILFNINNCSKERVKLEVKR